MLRISNSALSDELKKKLFKEIDKVCKSVGSRWTHSYEYFRVDPAIDTEDPSVFAIVFFPSPNMYKLFALSDSLQDIENSRIKIHNTIYKNHGNYLQLFNAPKLSTWDPSRMDQPFPAWKVRIEDYAYNLSESEIAFYHGVALNESTSDPKYAQEITKLNEQFKKKTEQLRLNKNKQIKTLREKKNKDLENVRGPEADKIREKFFKDKQAIVTKYEKELEKLRTWKNKQKESIRLKYQ